MESAVRCGARGEGDFVTDWLASMTRGDLSTSELPENPAINQRLPIHSACVEDDPGRSLGIHITNHPTNPITIDFWPQTLAPENVLGVNTLADMLTEGASEEEIQRRPR